MQINFIGQTDRFNLSKVGEDFINDCCFGEDLSEWLVSELTLAGFPSDVICMEDFGFANQSEHNGRSYLVCVSGYSEEKPQNPNFGTWFIMVEKKRSFLEFFTGKNKLTTKEPICIAVQSLLSKAGFTNIKVEVA